MVNIAHISSYEISIDKSNLLCLLIDHVRRSRTAALFPANGIEATSNSSQMREPETGLRLSFLR
jgi:hypothetical protein